MPVSVPVSVPGDPRCGPGPLGEPLSAPACGRAERADSSAIEAVYNAGPPKERGPLLIGVIRYTSVI